MTPEVSYAVGGASAHGTFEPRSFKVTAVKEAEGPKVSGADTEINAATGCSTLADDTSIKHDVAPTGLGVGSLRPTGTEGENSKGAHLVNEPSICTNSTKVHKDDSCIFA